MPIANASGRRLRTAALERCHALAVTRESTSAITNSTAAHAAANISAEERLAPATSVAKVTTPPNVRSVMASRLGTTLRRIAVTLAEQGRSQ
jgi:hypothetical protein